jgi:hypothetical protein
MKAKVLTKVNMLIGLLLGLLGFSSCERGQVVVEYGSPFVDTTVHVMYGVEMYGVYPVDMDQPDENNE